jgi:hypothetical protein
MIRSRKDNDVVMLLALHEHAWPAPETEGSGQLARSHYINLI